MAGRQPRAIAIGDDLGELDYQGLDLAIDGAATLLDAGRVGLLLANGRHWAVADLALAHRGALCIPLPGFFTDSQLGHVIRDADLDLIVTDDPRRVQDLLGGGSAAPSLLAGREVWLFRRLRTGGAGAPAGTAKVTYTSGTTGQPKGVCLAGEAIAGDRHRPVPGGERRPGRPRPLPAPADDPAGEHRGSLCPALCRGPGPGPGARDLRHGRVLGPDARGRCSPLSAAMHRPP